MSSPASPGCPACAVHSRAQPGLTADAACRVEHTTNPCTHIEVVTRIAPLARRRARDWDVIRYIKFDVRMLFVHSKTGTTTRNAWQLASCQALVPALPAWCSVACACRKQGTQQPHCVIGVSLHTQTASALQGRPPHPFWHRRGPFILCTGVCAACRHSLKLFGDRTEGSHCCTSMPCTDAVSCSHMPGWPSTHAQPRTAALHCLVPATGSKEAFALPAAGSCCLVNVS